MVSKVIVGSAIGALASRLLPNSKAQSSEILHSDSSERAQGWIRPPQLTKEEFMLIVTLMIGFGNMFTLPVLFLKSLYPSQLGQTMGYLAFAIMGWSPLFWGVTPLFMGAHDADSKTSKGNKMPE